MKKFGFGSKKGGDDGGDDDASRSALFGRKKSSQPPAGDNPYAQAPPANDPYAQSSKSAAASAPYQQQRPGGFQSNPYGGGGGGGSSGGLPGGPGPRRNPSGSGASTYSQPPPPYGGDANERSSSGYGADRYGASGGYGDNRYDNGGGGSGGGYGGANRYGASSAASARGPGGYGGLGRTNSNDTDAQRDQLFSGAQQRNQQRQQGGHNGYGQDNAGGSSSSAGAGAGDDPYGGYGAERELTEEEIEAQEVRDVKKQIQDTRQESINSLQRSIALAHQAADTGINTMNILARDEERLNNTEKRLDEAANYNKIGAERAKKLKNLNRSMFAVHVNNPFTNSKRTAEYEQNVIDNHRAERELRNETRKNGWDSSQQMEQTMRGLNLGDKSQQRGSGKSSAAEKSKYVFLDEDDDENNQALEDEATIDRQMDELSGAVSVLNRVAKAQTQTVQRQIVTADRINEKTDMVDDGVRLNRARLDRIK
ncbi:hypothetical protein VD0004_g592 [Verticillium dahliae]|uniref:Uncharacterized protein n=1 Tax=Verticillium dahliae TaxID=27337 RepID=A0A366PV89_VERDA|nr:hypothetical protein VD0004_g592 [Verticillium dahliae]PNH76981.1 hypothetical protein VD0001_g547 [Verticillium dahliae]RBQ96558.1 hypothetical protein VDGD_04327 [Verticillium dahliae]RXG47912.1 hypothetical protein VDGE_04327 [Verticillium dahliae]